MSGDLTAFVTARLDEDEWRANEMGHETEESETYSCPGSRTEPLGDLEWGEEHCWCGLAERKGRALREVTAKRAIVTLHRPRPMENWQMCSLCRPVDPEYPDDLTSELWPCRTLRALAAIYSDHPDFDQKWST